MLWSFLFGGNTNAENNSRKQKTNSRDTAVYCGDCGIQVSKLRLLKQNFLSEKYALEDSLIKYYPVEIRRQEEKLSGLQEDLAHFQNQLKNDREYFAGMTVDGVSYAEKAEAGEAILSACRNMKNPEPEPLGAYRSFDMTLSFDTLNPGI